MIRALGIAVVVLLIALPAAAQKVQIDYDRSVDFSTYKSFAWVESDETSLKQLSPLMHSRLKNAIEDRFGRAGIMQVEPNENPDLFITYHTDAKEEVRYNTTSFGYGYGPGWYYGGGLGSSTTTAYSYTKGTLIIDLWDAKSKTLIWRGVSTATVPENPEKGAKLIEQTIEKLGEKWKKMYEGPAK